MKWKRKTRRQSPKFNTSSIADIAFLALVFFLLTSVTPEEKGILVKLPPFCDDGWCGFGCGKPRGFIHILINGNDKVLIASKPESLENVSSIIKEWILNPYQVPYRTPRNTIISLQCNRQTSYDTYIQVYSQLKKAYNEIWEEEALIRYGFHFRDLNTKQKMEIHHDFPQVISEAEPVDFYTKKIVSSNSFNEEKLTKNDD